MKKIPAAFGNQAVAAHVVNRTQAASKRQAMMGAAIKSGLIKIDPVKPESGAERQRVSGYTRPNGKAVPSYARRRPYPAPRA